MEKKSEIDLAFSIYQALSEEATSSAARFVFGKDNILLCLLSAIPQLLGYCSQLVLQSYMFGGGSGLEPSVSRLGTSLMGKSSYYLLFVLWYLFVGTLASNLKTPQLKRVSYHASQHAHFIDQKTSEISKCE